MRFISSLVLFLCAAPVSAREVSVGEVLVAAEKASPDLKAAAARESQARDSILLGKSYYYPTLDAEGIQSYGFAGSNGALGLGGIPSSPFRSGPTGGLVSRMTLFDWSRGYGVEAARSRLKAAQAQTRIVRTAVDQAVLRVYFEGVRYRGQMEAWRQVGVETERVLKEVEHLVRTGQHSPVDRYLVQDQADDAAMQAAALAKRYQITLKRLSLLTAIPDSDLACPNPVFVSESNLTIIIPGAASPAVERAQAEVEASKKIVSQRSAANYPTVSALASVGGMDKVRLVNRQDYSAGFGVTLPIFEGFRTKSEISSAKDASTERDYNLLSAKLDLDETNASYDEIIDSSRIKLDFLARRLDHAEQALNLAKQRYRSFEGPLVDVRESIRNLARIKTEVNDVKSDLLFALGSQILVNGGHIEGKH